jgi:hypothetical protein
MESITIPALITSDPKIRKKKCEAIKKVKIRFPLLKFHG